MKLNPITRHGLNIDKAAPKKRNEPWTDYEEQRMKELRKAGYSNKGIASILGRSLNSVEQKTMRQRGTKI